MHATCPTNPDHNKFVTVAHIMQDWLVDAEGNFLEATEECLDVTHGPNPENTWTCNECGAVAIVK